MTVRIEVMTDLATDALSELRTLAAGLTSSTSMSPVTAPEVERRVAEVAAQAETAPKATRTRKAAKAEEAAQISTGENRVGPEDDAETAAQDAADEAAEVEATKAAAKELTADDLRQAMGGYVTKHGIEAAQADGVQVFEDAIGVPPDGDKYWKITTVAAAGQATLAKAIDAWQKAAESNARYGAK